MKRMWIAFLMLAVAAMAQDKPKEEPKDQTKTVQRLFILKYADPSQIYDVLHVFAPSMIPNREMHALTVSAPPEAIAAIEDALKHLDVPGAAPKDVDLTVYLVLGAETSEQAGGPLPKDLENVVAQLRNTFQFKNYGLLDVMTLRTSDTRSNGRTPSTNSSGGTVNINGRPHNVMSNLQIGSLSVSSDGTVVRITGLEAGCQIPYAAGENNVQTHNLNLHTDVDIKEGQKVVVGRMGMNQGQALFLVITAKVL
jgi:hypothetical protein